MVLVLVKWDVHFFCFSINSRELNFRSGFSGLSPPDEPDKMALTLPTPELDDDDEVMLSSDFNLEMLCWNFGLGSIINLEFASGGTMPPFS